MHRGDDVKKILFSLGIILFVFAVLLVSYFGISNFYKVQTQTYNMHEIKISITKKEEWEGRNPSLTLYTKDANTIYEIPAVWFDEFDADVFNDNFTNGKEYILIVNKEEIADDLQGIYVYGIYDNEREYLSTENAILADKSNSIFGLIVGLAFICGLMVLISVTIFNRKTVVAFLKEFYTS